MIHTDQKITNRLGIHARPAALIAQTASGFTADIQLEKDGVRVNAKSIMGVMMLAAEFGSTLRISADGIDEKQAIMALSKLFENRFNEEF
jgi:phosphocarrier protein